MICYVWINYCIQYNIINIQTQVSSGEGLEGNQRTIRASPQKLKLELYIVKEKEKEIVRKCNIYKFLIAMISWPISYIVGDHDQSPLSYS